MRKYIFLLAFCCICANLFSEVTLRYRLSPLAGMMMKDGKVDPWLTNQPMLGAEFAVEFLPTGKWHCLQEWNNSSVGLSLTYYNLGNDQKLGHLFAPAVYLQVPLVHTPHFEFGLRPGVGLGFATRWYENTVDEGQKYISVKGANQSIGGVVSAYLPEALYFDFIINKEWRINLTGGWYHFSNGSIKQPNAGYNMFNGMLGVCYTPANQNYEAPPTDVSNKMYKGKNWDVELSVIGGVKQAYYRDRTFFGVGAVSLSSHWKALSVFKIGGGIDFFYDGYYSSVNKEFAKEGDAVTYFGKTYLSESKLSNCFRLGLSLQPELVLGRFTTGFHFGFYLIDPIKNLETKDAVEANGGPFNRGIFYPYDMLNAGSAGHADGWLYTRLTFKYRITDHFFVEASMKTHLMKAEFVGVGIGACL